jgi:hypothetical protein
VATELLVYGADTSSKDVDGNTPLHLAVIASDEVMQRSQGDKLDFCALLCNHLSAKSAETPAPEFLIKSEVGSTPWDVAYDTNQLILIEVIFQYGGFEACSRLIYRGRYVGDLLIARAVKENAWDLVVLLLNHEETLAQYQDSEYRIHRDTGYLQSAARISDKANIKRMLQSAFGLDVPIPSSYNPRIWNLALETNSQSYFPPESSP